MGPTNNDGNVAQCLDSSTGSRGGYVGENSGYAQIAKPFPTSRRGHDGCRTHASRRHRVATLHDRDVQEGCRRRRRRALPGWHDRGHHGLAPQLRHGQHQFRALCRARCRSGCCPWAAVKRDGTGSLFARAPRAAAHLAGQIEHQRHRRWCRSPAPWRARVRAVSNRCVAREAAAMELVIDLERRYSVLLHSRLNAPPTRSSVPQPAPPRHESR